MLSLLRKGSRFKMFGPDPFSFAPNNTPVSDQLFCQYLKLVAQLR